jgi:hypothetical protein
MRCLDGAGVFRVGAERDDSPVLRPGADGVEQAVVFGDGGADDRAAFGDQAVPAQVEQEQGMVGIPWRPAVRPA